MTEPFLRVETNPHVQEDLRVLSNAESYRAWLFSLIEPYLGQRVLEIGSGIGNYTEKLLGRERIWATDYDPKYVTLLQNKFRDRQEMHTMVVDLSNITAQMQKFYQTEKIDTIIVLNVLEHIDRDLGAVNSLKGCLGEKGRIVIVVPALQHLFCRLDQAYGHHRRYRRRDFIVMGERLELTLEVCHYFNFLGIFGWWFNTKIRRKTFLPKTQTRLFDRMVPLLQYGERLLRPPIGLSLLCVFSR